MSTPLSQIFHVYNRLGFGITYPEAKILSDKSLNEIVQSIIVTSTIGTYITEIKKEDALLLAEAMKDKSDRKETQARIRELNRNLNLAWMKKLLETKNILLEKQTLFWHNHFACRVQHPYLMQELNNIHRRFAFSNFRDLLVEVSKSPGMLVYLNNQQNRKEHPNENFARELMELFTLGRGNYTEQDVQEAARAFTGWAFNKESGEFEFREKAHDGDEKTIFNRKGNFGGEDVINMIMSKKQTAVFLCRKMYRYYVNENVNEAHVKELADFYYQNQYNTGALVKKIFSSPWFFSPENMGCNIKSPVEFIVTLARHFNMDFQDEQVLLKLQRVLGQVLFSPPNVAGWPGGKNFIDSSTLLLRMRIPSLLLNNGELEIPDRPDEHEQMNEAEKGNKKLNVAVNWEKITTAYAKIEKENLYRCFLAKQPAQQIIDKINSDLNLPLKELILKIVSLPEYSLV